MISVTAGEQGLLCTTSEFADYVLKVDFRAPSETNSGIFLRTPPQPTDPAADCYELNIADRSISPFPTGSFVEPQKAERRARQRPSGARSGHAPRAGTSPSSSTASRCSTTPIPSRSAAGYIGLQFNTGPVEFRNIKLKPLGLRDALQRQGPGRLERVSRQEERVLRRRPRARST